MRNEDPPNKEVHASDLASALDSLKQEQTTPQRNVDPDTPVSMTSTSPMEKTRSAAPPSGQRSRSSTIIYQPEDHGSDANLPQVLVEDTSLSPAMDSDVEMSEIDMPVKKMPPKTSRPPVELME